MTITKIRHANDMSDARRAIWATDDIEGLAFNLTMNLPKIDGPMTVKGVTYTRQEREILAFRQLAHDWEEATPLILVVKLAWSNALASKRGMHASQLARLIETLEDLAN